MGNSFHGFRLGQAMFAATLIIASSPVLACSVAPDYKVPNTLELVQRADAIVLAEVIGLEQGAAGEGTFVIFRPMNRIKGKTLPGDLRLEGMLADAENPVAASDPYELAAPHPNALTGGCRRYVFERGAKLILFLEKNGETLEIATYPSARSLEDVPFPEAPWALAVSMYLRIANLPEQKHCDALKKRLEFHRTLSSDFRAPIYARDIERHIEDLAVNCF